MKQFAEFCLVALALSCARSSCADQFNRNTDWMAGKIGIFQHHLYNNDTNALAKMRGYDAKAVAAQLKDIGASHFCITLLQVWPNIIAPNATYERFSEGKPGEHCFADDIPAQLVRELKGSGVKLMLYAPGTPPRYDEALCRNMGWKPHPAGNHMDPIATAEGARNWAKVFEEWSVRYGKDVVGWWIDGCFPRSGFTNADVRADIAYPAALKKGNPDAVVAFNPTCELKTYVPQEDYTAGEVNEPFRFPCLGRWVDGRQWHMLTYLYAPMCFPGLVRYTDGEWTEILKPIVARGGCVTLDCGCEFPSGLIPVRYAGQIKRIISAVYGKPMSEEDARGFAIEAAVRRVTDAIDARDTIHVEPAKHKFLYTGYAWGDSRPDASCVRRNAAGEEIWNDAIQATLDRCGHVYLPGRKEPYLVDAPVVMRDGQSFGAAHALAAADGDGGYATMIGALKPGRQAVLSPAKGYAGALLVNAPGARNVRVHGLAFKHADAPVRFDRAEGLVLREVIVRTCTGAAVSLSGVKSFRVDGVRCDACPHDLACAVRADAACSSGLIRNVGMIGDRTLTAVRSAARDTIVEASVGRDEFTGTGVHRAGDAASK